MPTARVFASLADAAGTRVVTADGATLEEFLRAAALAYGEEFSRQLAHCRLVVNGDTVDRRDAATTRVGPDDEIALLPPVAGGGPDPTPDAARS